MMRSGRRNGIPSARASKPAEGDLHVVTPHPPVDEQGRDHARRYIAAWALDQGNPEDAAREVLGALGLLDTGPGRAAGRCACGAELPICPSWPARIDRNRRICATCNSQQSPPPPPKPKKVKAEVADCGTLAGYKRHKRHDEPACGPCREANNEYKRRHHARNASTSTRKPAFIYEEEVEEL